MARVLIVSTQLMPEIVEYPERDKSGGVFVMTEPPYTGAPYDEARGACCACSGATTVFRSRPTSPPRALPTLRDVGSLERDVRRGESNLLDPRQSALGPFRAIRVVGDRLLVSRVELLAHVAGAILLLDDPVAIVPGDDGLDRLEHVVGARGN